MRSESRVLTARALALAWTLAVALATSGAAAGQVLDDFASGNLGKWARNDDRVARAEVLPGGPEGKAFLALTSKPNAGWATITLPFDPPLDLRGKYLSVWLKQDEPATGVRPSRVGGFSGWGYRDHPSCPESGVVVMGHRSTNTKG